MVGKLLLVCTISTALMFRFPVLGRYLGIVVAICIGILVIKGWVSLCKSMIKFFNYLNDSDVRN